MSGLFESINSWYQSLAQQEQRILLFGSPLILVLVLYLLVFQPLGSAYFARQNEISERREDIAWVRDQRVMLERLNTSCDVRSQIFSSESFQSEIDAAARRFGLVPAIRAVSGSDGYSDSYEIQISNAEGNRILNLVRVLACGGAKVTNLEMQRQSAESTELNATLSVARAGA